jgi:hypothetical protein
MTKEGRIRLATGGTIVNGKRTRLRRKTYPKSDFPTLFLDGLTCESDQCLIQNVDSSSGDMAGKYEAP